jgi:hypothetical protein
MSNKSLFTIQQLYCLSCSPPCSSRQVKLKTLYWMLRVLAVPTVQLVPGATGMETDQAPPAQTA